MKKLYLSLILSAFIVSDAVASDIGKALGRADVSRLELLANNMNILTVIDKIQTEKDKKDQAKGEDIENTATKYSVSKDYRLIIEDFYKASVTNVTNKTCNEQLRKLKETISGDNSKFAIVLSMLSPTALTPEQAQQILNEAYLAVYMQAKENSQLSLNCSK